MGPPAQPEHGARLSGIMTPMAWLDLHFFHLLAGLIFAVAFGWALVVSHRFRRRQRQPTDQLLQRQEEAIAAFIDRQREIDRLDGRQVSFEPPISSRRAHERYAPMVALFSALAATVHLSVIGSHFEEGFSYGMFFLAATAGQAGWAWLIVRTPAESLFRIGAIANAAVICLWLVSRIVGIPGGEAPWSPQPVGTLDLVASLCEAGVVAGCLAALNARSNYRRGGQATRNVSGASHAMTN